MIVSRTIFFALAGASIFAASPASAQFFFKSHEPASGMVNGDEPGIGLPMPGATPEELTASLVWTLRAGLNVAALQCQFEPTLLTVPNYNALLADHNDELKASFDTLTKYFARTAKTKKAGQEALDQFGTRIYSGFSTVSAQYNFCQAAGDIGRAAIHAPRGGLGALAHAKMREMRNSLVPWGEQQFPGSVSIGYVNLPRMDDQCWKHEEWNASKCGADPYATAYAVR